MSENVSSVPPAAPSAPGGTWPMYRAMVGVGILCGLLIVTVFLVTRPVIRRNKAEALRRAVFAVLPQARSSTSFRLDAAGAFAPSTGDDGRDPLVHAGYDDAERLVGLAIEAEGMGYQDVIRVLYGYSLDEQAIVGIRVLESKETPGLGDRIETDPAFLENFRRLPVELTEDGGEIRHPIEGVKHGKKEHPWQVDAITGATISSQAIANILSKSTAYWIPKVRRRADDFRRAE